MDRSKDAVLDVEAVRRDFPALAQRIHGRPLAYLDSAASAQKPEAVMAAQERCYREYYSNVHRGVHSLSQRATEAYERARSRVARFLGAADDREIVFVRGTTEGINLVAQTLGRRRLSAGDEVLITEMEHHSNIVPWQMLCEERDAQLRVAPIDDHGQVILEEFHRRLGERTRIASFVHVSNALGTINPVREMTAAAQAAGAVVLVDGAQAAPHLEIDVAGLGCDFYVFSAHKAYGPTGVGALYGRLELLDEMPPYQGGGEMIRSVTFEKTEYAPPPARFEAGTPDIVGAIGLAAALDYLDGHDRAAIQRHEDDLLEYGSGALRRIPGVRLIGTAAHKAAVLSFVVDGVHAHDVGTILDLEGIAVRVGHHCAQPVMHHFRVPATARASLAIYNRRDEIDRLTAGVGKVREVFA
ncbi:MAG: SufS family cysteine desulfurase [Thermoanaerobaculia bacterium]